MAEKKGGTFDRLIYLQGEDSINVTLKKEAGSEKIVKVNGRTENEIKDLEKGESLKDYAYRRLRTRYKEYFSNTFENLVFLTGAGSSKGIGKKRKGLLTSEFWLKVDKHLKDKYGEENLFLKLCELVDYDGDNIEELLSKIFLLTGFKDNPVIKIEKEEDEEVFEVRVVVKEIESKIRELCTLELPDNSPHVELLRKVGKRKPSLPRVKIFTLNYDLLFEQASTEINAILIDGFSYSYPREFSGRNFDYDIVKRENTKLKKDQDYLERVFHLYKPHGSINWKQSENPTKVIIDDNPENALMIYPRSNKYEASYDQPFFEMLSRFQTALRSQNTTLVTIGFSFSDKHIVTAIIEALNQNPSFNLVIIDPYFGATQSLALKKLIDYSKRTNRIIFIGDCFEDFAKNYPENKSYPERQYQDFDLGLNLNSNQNIKIESKKVEPEESGEKDDEPPF